MEAMNGGTFLELADRLPGGGERAERAARTLRDMSLEGPAARDAALRLGAVQALLPHLRPHTPLQILTLLVQAVSNWCRRVDDAPAVRLALVEPVLPLLKDLLLNGDPDILEAACTAVTNLTHGPGGHTGALQAVPELTASLVVLLHQETAARVTRAALRAVANMLAGTTTQVERCIDAGFLDYIVPLLRSSDTFLVEHAARATANIFTHAVSTEQALDVGVLAPLPNIIDNGDDACCKQALKAINNLCYHGTAVQRGRFLSSGVLQPYCAVLTRPNHTLAALVLAGLNVLVQATEKGAIVEAHYNIFYDFEDMEDPDFEDERKVLYLKLDETDVIDLTEQLLERQEIDENLRRRAQELSAAVRWHARGETLIVENGKLYTPAEIVRDLRRELARQVGAARAARRMLCRARAQGPARLEAVSRAMVEAVALPALIEALDEGVCSDLQYEAAWVLVYITYARQHNSQYFEMHAIPTLVALVANKGQAAIPAAYTLRNLTAYGEETKEKILMASAVTAMLPYMTRDTPLRRLRPNLSAYKELCYYTNSLSEDKLIHLTPALPCMTDWLNIEDQQVLELACGALQNLMRGSEDAMKQVQAVPGVTERLAVLMGHEAPDVQRAALKAVGIVCTETDETPVKRCLEAGCLDHLVRFLRSSDPSLVEEAAQAMSDIVRHFDLIQRTVQTDIVTPLLEVLASGDLECQVLTTRAIRHLCNTHSTVAKSEQVVQRCSALLAARDTTPTAEPPVWREDLTQELREQVCHIFQSVTSHPEGIVAVLATPELPGRLVALLGQNSQTAAVVQSNALKIVKNILGGTDTQVEQFVVHIVRLLRSSELDGVAGAARAAGEIKERSFLQQKALDKDVLSALLDVLTGGELECQEHAAQAIRDLCMTSCGAREAISRGVVQRCSELLAARDTTPVAEPPAGRDDLTQKLREHVYYILQSVTSHPEVMTAVLAVPELTMRLVALLAQNSQAADGMQIMVLKTVKNILGGNTRMVERCLDSGCLEHILRFLRSSDSALLELAVQSAQQIFSNIAMVRDLANNSEQFWDVFTEILDILANGEIKCQVQAVWAINAVFKNVSTSQFVAAVLRGVVERCSALLAARDTTPAAEPPAGRDDLTQELRLGVCYILQAVTWDPEEPCTEGIDAVLAEPELISRLLSLLPQNSGTEHEVYEAALEIVNNISLYGTDTQVQQCVDHVMRLLAGEELECQVQATKAFPYLCKTPTGIEEVVSHGVLERCSTLLAARDTTPTAEPAAGRDNLTQELQLGVCDIVDTVLWHHREGEDMVLAVPELMARMVTVMGHNSQTANTQQTLAAVRKLLDGTYTQAEQCVYLIVRLLRSNDPASVAGAARAAGVIRISSMLEQKAPDKDVLSPLLDVLTGGELECQVQAARAIDALCMVPGGAAEAVSRGVVQRCIEVLATRDTMPAVDPPIGLDDLTQDLRKQVCNILVAVTSHAEGIEAVLAEDGLMARLIARLGQNLRTAYNMFDKVKTIQINSTCRGTNEQPEVREQVCDVVREVTSHREAIDEALAADGVTSRLLDVLYKNNNTAEEVQIKALEIVKNILRKGTDTQIEQCVTLIVRLLRSNDPASVAGAARAAGVITISSMLVQKAPDKNFLSPLLDLLIDGEIECQVQAARSIGNLCTMGGAAEAVLRAGMVKRCSKLLAASIYYLKPMFQDRKGPKQELYEQLVLIIQRVMVNSEEGIDTVLAEPELLEVLLSHSLAEVHETAVVIVMYIVDKTAVQAADCLERVVQLLRSPESSRVMGGARAAGKVLAGKPAQIQRALEKDILTTLRDFLAVGSESIEEFYRIRCQGLVAQAITNLCRHGSPEQRNKVVEREVLQPYCGLLGNPELESKAVADILDGLDRLLQDDQLGFNGTALRSHLRELGVRSQIEKLSTHEENTVNTKAGELLSKYTDF